MTAEEKLSNLTEQLRTVIKQVILDRERDDNIDPVLVSSLAVRKLDPDNESKELVAWGCVLELRQIAREELRGKHDPTRDDQRDFFDGMLQDRYPTVTGGYAKRFAMTRDDYLLNENRLDKNAKALQKHKDALTAERLDREAKGDWKIQA